MGSKSIVNKSLSFHQDRNQFTAHRSNNYHEIKNKEQLQINNRKDRVKCIDDLRFAIDDLATGRREGNPSMAFTGGVFWITAAGK
jgi:hypothetical protein